MSHQPERKAKDCLNCGTLVHGRFCHVCGQENIVTHQNFTGLARHFIYDIFHFDGKFFDTLKNLFFKPGVVAGEYVKGKRAKYLDPIRMYLFTSALFFLIFFTFKKPELVRDSGTSIAIPEKTRMDLINGLKEELNKKQGDSVLSKKIALLLDTTKQVTFEDLNKIDPPSIINDNDKKYRSAGEYDSLQKLLPEARRDNWLTRGLYKKAFEMKTKYKGNLSQGVNDFADKFLHQMPYLLFLSLPFFALVLKFLYVRRKNFFYSDHAVFTLYHYIFSFFLLMFMFAFDSLGDITHWKVFFNWMMGGLCVLWLLYLYKSMRNFYTQSRIKTITKFLLLNLLGFFVLLILFLFFFFFSIFQM